MQETPETGQEQAPIGQPHEQPAEGFVPPQPPQQPSAHPPGYDPSIPDEPPEFREAIKGKSVNEILHDKLIEPHVYIMILITATIFVAIIIGLIEARL